MAVQPGTGRIKQCQSQLSPQPSKAKQTMTGETILVIEDNEIQREGLAFVLREAGYTVLTAKDGKDGLSWLRSQPTPDLLVLDMLIRQGLDGWHFLALRKQDPKLACVPVIITTGLGSACDEWAASLGACTLLRKPLEPEDIIAAVKKYL
jgi:CheY-like chemotaxis protein